MLQSWRSTNSLNLATTLNTCGVQIVPITALDERPGKRITRYDYAEWVTLPPHVLPADDPDQIRKRFSLTRDSSNPAYKINAGLIRATIEDGSMETADPEHFALDVYLGLQARECYRTMMEKGTRYRIQVHPKAPRAKLVPGDDPLAMGTANQIRTWATRDLAIAAAVSRIGCPVINIKPGSDGRKTFILPRFGHRLPGRPGPEDAEAIASMIINGDLARHCPEHPCVWIIQGIRNRLVIQKHTESTGLNSTVLIYKPSQWARNGRSALVQEHGTTAAFDDAYRHLSKQ